MRLRFALLFALASCAPASKPSPAPKDITAGKDAADASTLATATEDGGATPASSSNEPCAPKPCRVSERAVDVASDGNDVVFLRTFGQGGRHQLVKRGPDDKEDVVLATDVRPSRTARVRHLLVDKDVVFLATNEGVATWEKNSVLTLIGPHGSGADQITTDDTSVYFMGSDCTLRKVAKTGGTIEELVKTNVNYCGLPELAADDANVYFTADDTLYVTPKGVKGKARPGKRVFLPRSEQRFVLGLTLDADNVYVLVGPPQTGGSKGRLLRIPKKGGAPVELAKPEPVGNAYTLGSDATRLFWLEAAQAKVFVVSMAKPGGERKVIAEAPGIGYSMTVATSSVYFVAWEMTGSPGSVPRVWRVTK